MADTDHDSDSVVADAADAATCNDAHLAFSTSVSSLHLLPHQLLSVLRFNG